MLIIMGKPAGGKWEEIDTAKDKEEARYLIGEYQVAFGAGWVFKTKKEK